MRRTFTAEFKRLAVALVLEESFTVKGVTKQLDVHENTLYRWIQEVETFGPRAFPGKEAGIILRKIKSSNWRKRILAYGRNLKS